MNDKLVSVIIPVYNSDKYLEQTLESVFAQTYKSIEIIVVNDGSTDGSREILRRYENIITIIDQNNTGQAVARNNGVNRSNGQLLAFLDSDDLWDKHKIERQVAIIDEFPEAIGTYCDVRRINSDNEVICRSESLDRNWPSGHILAPLLYGRAVISMTPSQVMIRRESFLQAKGFPAESRLGEDYALWLKLALLGPILYQLETLVSYRRHPGGISIGKDFEFGWLNGRFQALLDVYDDILALKDASTKELYLQELHYSATTLGWFLRKRSEFRRAAEVYRIASISRPLSVETRCYSAACMLLAKFLNQ